MPLENDKAAISARRDALLSGETGVTESSSRYSGNTSDAGRLAKAGVGMSQEMAVANALKSYMVKNKLAKNSGSNIEMVDEYHSSHEVVAAIKEGKLAKSQAVVYCEKFQLVKAEKLDDLTPNAALEILTNDSNDEVLHDKILAEVVDKCNTEDAPSPDGSVNVKKQLPSTDTPAKGTEKPKYEDVPTPDGKVSPKTQLPNTKIPNDSTVNDAKTEDKMPSPVTSQIKNPTLPSASNDSTVNSAKPEGMPSVETPSMKKQMPSNGFSGSGDKVNKEDAPTPDHVSSVTAQALPPMPPMGGDMPEDKPMDMGGKPLDMGGEKGDKGKSKNQKHEDIKTEINHAVDLISDLKEVFDCLYDKIEKKDKKKAPKMDKPSDEKKDEGKPEGKSEEKKDNPFPPKKDGPKDEKKEDKPLPTELPPIAGSYSLDYIKDEKSPVDSYYIASLAGKPLFSVTARHAFGKEASKHLEMFGSKDYVAEFASQLNAKGAKATFAEVFGSIGVVLAQEEKLPEDKFSAPAKPMNVAPEVQNNIENNDTQKQGFSDLVIETLAMNIAGNKSSSSSEAVDELRGVFSDENKAKEFEGRLSEKVEQKKKDIDATHSPDAVGKPDAPIAPPAAGPEQMKAMSSKLEKMKAMMPEIVAAVKERDELRVKLDEISARESLKARTMATYSLAERKAGLGLIDSEDTKQEALRLAKLTDAEISEENKILEKSIKIAKNIKKTDDSTKIEDKNIKVAGNVLPAVPSSMDCERKIETFQWSSGIKRY